MWWAVWALSSLSSSPDIQWTGAQCSILGSVGALGSVLGTANGQCGEYFGQCGVEIGKCFGQCGVGNALGSVVESVERGK